jgi:glycosyltransferase involved in cell wall biosynthesis
VWDYSLELCRGLAHAGTEVTLAVMGPPPDPQQAAAAACISGVELSVAPFKLEWMQDPWKDVAAAGAWLLDLERRCGCELVHLNGYAHGALPFRSPTVVVGHSCVLSWWRAVRHEDAPPAWERYRREVRRGLRAADRVVAPTAAMRRALDEHYGPLTGALVIPNGRTAGEWAPGDKDALVVSAGRLWDEAKNARALARVADRLPWRVLIAGAAVPSDPSARDRDVAVALARGTRARLLGRLPSAQLAALFARAAIYALPARYEPFGLTVLEAALSECALVLGDIPSLRELWNGAALFVHPDDDEALEMALLTLMNQPELTAYLAERARRRAQRLSAMRMTRRYLAVYRSLIAGAGQSEVLASCVS